MRAGRRRVKLTGVAPMPSRFRCKDYGTDREGWPLLSPQLVHEGEIDWYIQAFKDDLDRVGRLAKAALKRANQRTHERVRERLSVSD